MLPANLTYERFRHALYWRYWHFKTVAPAYMGLWLTRIRWALGLPRPKQHKLPHQLVISLTSYRARFSTLRPTLQCLLRQSVKPDAVILWIDERDAPHLPPAIKTLEQQGLTIKATPDLMGPYKKIIPALMAYPEAAIVTADDDIYYRPHWLRDLLAGWDGNARTITCHRAHCIRYEANQPAPYAQWELDVEAPVNERLLFPTGVGGVLYPPGALPVETTDMQRFMALSPKADDLWLFWMARRNGCTYRLAQRQHSIVAWPGSQHVGLMHSNLDGGGNDQQIAALTAAYGWPVEPA